MMTYCFFDAVIEWWIWYTLAKNYDIYI